MNIQAIHDERIGELQLMHNEGWEDAEVGLKKTTHELWKCFTDIDGISGKKSDLVLWLHFSKEKVEEAMNALNMLADELDEIEEEITRDEVNNAG